LIVYLGVPSCSDTLPGREVTFSLRWYRWTSIPDPYIYDEVPYLFATWPIPGVIIPAFDHQVPHVIVDSMPAFRSGWNFVAFNDGRDKLGRGTILAKWGSARQNLGKCR
jgi:hypothetical protein